MQTTKTRTAAFLETLADASEEYRYYRNPIAVMTEFGLSTDEQEVILNGSIEDIREAAGERMEAFQIKCKFPVPVVGRSSRLTLRRG